MVNKQLDALTGTRGFAAILVVIFHFALNVIPDGLLSDFFANGNLAVSYFFTLSGFIMCYTYYSQRVGYSSYMKKRIARIVPLYLFALLLTIALLSTYPDGFGKQLVLNTFLLQAYFPDYALTLNGPGWSLSVEMFFYLLFPLFIIMYRYNEKGFAVFAILFYIISQALHLWLIAIYKPEYGSGLHEFVFYHPVMHLSQFLIGMAGYYLFSHIQSIHKYLSPVVLFLIIAACVLYLPLSKHNGLLAPLFVLFIVGVATSRKSLLATRPLVYFGEISYGIYILQMPVFMALQKLNDTALHLSYGYFLMLFFVALLLFSALCYRFVEKPLRRKISSL